MKAGQTQGAFDLVCGMGSYPLDVITYNIVISSLSKSCKMDQALDLLNAMIF
jgi:pentatricopeptide repeat protein